MNPAEECLLGIVASHTCTFCNATQHIKKLHLHEGIVAQCNADERIATQRCCHEKQMPVSK